MDIMLNEIAELLRARGLTIAIGTNPAEPASQIWDVSDVPEETVIRVMIFPDYNGYPSFWRRPLQAMRQHTSSRL